MKGTLLAHSDPKGAARFGTHNILFKGRLCRTCNRGWRVSKTHPAQRGGAGPLDLVVDPSDPAAWPASSSL